MIFRNQSRAITIIKVIKWLGIIGGFCGLVFAGAIFMAKTQTESDQEKLPSPVNKIDVKSIEKSLDN